MLEAIGETAREVLPSNYTYEFGGISREESKFENQFVGAMLGNAAQCKFYPGDVVAASLRFSTRDYNGATYQDILVTDIVKLNK